MKVLIVDPQKSISGIIADMLALEGYEVFESDNGKKAIEMYLSDNPEIVIMYLGVKDISPGDILREIRNISKTTQLILVTDFGLKDIEQEISKYGIFETINKNIGSELFLKLINKFVKKITALSSQKTQIKNVKSKVLVVDDSMLIRQTLKDFLEEKGYSVITAKDGKEALSMVKTENPTLMLLDITMPVMDGISVMKALKNSNLNLPVIIISSNSDIELARKTLNLGAYDYIAKPINFEYLETSILAKIMHKTYE